LKIYKDNIKIDEQISNINFIGNNILVKKNTNNDNWVDIYISSQNQNIQYTDNFNVGSTAIQQIVGTSRNVASPNGTSYDIGDWVAGESHPCINKDIIEFTTSNVYSFENENSTVGCRILNGSGIVIKELEVMNIGNHTTSDDDCIFITNSDYDQEYDRFVAKTEFVIHLNKILLNGGRFSVQLYNNNDTIGNYEFVQTNLFYDKQSYGGSIGNISISENVPIIKYLSGVAYYN
jgi:hypothetical protein